MKRAELKEGMAVYFVQHPYQWREASEDVTASRAVVLDLEHYTRTSFGKVIKHPGGLLVHIREFDRYERFVSLGQLRGEYEKTAKVRRELQGSNRRVKQSNILRLAERERVRQAVQEEAHELGFASVRPGFRDRDAQFLELTSAELHAMLAEVREYRRAFGDLTKRGEVSKDGSMG